MNKNELQMKRDGLKKLSQTVKAMMDSGEIEAATINSGLIELYRREGHQEFKTIKGWNKAGYSVKKGSKALLLWGEPKDITHPDPEKENDEFKYFPLCYVFSDRQVEASKFSPKAEMATA